MKHPAFAPDRRQFLKSTAALAAASTLPNWFVEEGRAATRTTRAPGPNEQPALALIGCGGRGRGVAKDATRLGRIVAVCDVDETRVEEAKKQFAGAEGYTDFRKVMARDDIHAIICGTVDHWHALVSIAAMRAGKDVYCEKPLTLTIDEGKRLVAVAKETKRVFQTGSQQRSDKNFRLACELVRNGRLGKLKHVDVWLPAGRREGPFAASPVPAGLNWDMWLGPTPLTDYVKERTHQTFRYWWDYSGGTMTDWGAHHNDITLWGLGLDRSGPTSIEAKPRVEMIAGGFSALSEYEVNYAYANGITHTCQSTAANAWNGSVVDPKGKQHGVRFEGSDGWLFVTRGKIEASQPEFLTTPLDGRATRLEASDDHMGNFFDCLRSRKAPICETEIGHRSASLCHLGVIALRLGRKLKWDPKAERFVGDRDADKWIARELRQPWSYDKV